MGEPEKQEDWDVGSGLGQGKLSHQQMMSLQLSCSQNKAMFLIH